MDSETVFFQDEAITVTNARFIVGSQTFAMRGITSVQGIKIPANSGGSTALIVTGVILAAIAALLSLWVLCGVGVLLVGVGIWVAKREKPIFAVVLRTSGGEVTAYRSYDWSYISQVIEALNQSIVSHG